MFLRIIEDIAYFVNTGEIPESLVGASEKLERNSKFVKITPTGSVILR